MEVIGRIPEKTALRKYAESDKPEFVAVCGRRRVGKTYLVREFFGGDFTFYMTGLASGNLEAQLSVFNEAAFSYSANDQDAPPQATSWMEAFNVLKTIIEQKSGLRKKIIFIDELPWLDTPRSGFLTALEAFWNNWASGRSDVMLIVCGSTTSWFMKNLLENKEGLHHRLTGLIMLEPFTLGECEQYCENLGLFLNRQLLLGIYMILGGTPFYYSLFDKEFTLPQNIDRLFFSDGGLLAGEFDELYGSLFRNPRHHIQIVSAMAKKNTPMLRDEIIEACGVKGGGTFSKALDDLVQCGFIAKYHDFQKSKNGAWYSLADAITLFWIRFVAGKKRSDRFWANHIEDAHFKAWRECAFEQICRRHIVQIKSALGISGVSSTTGSWRSADAKPGSKVNLLIDRRDDVVNLCEIEYSDAAFAIDRRLYNELTDNVRLFRVETETKKAVHMTFITPYGLKHNAYLNTADAEVTLNDLFRM